MSQLDYVCAHKLLKLYSKEKKWKSKDNFCAHVHKLNATLKLRIDIDQIDSISNFAQICFPLRYFLGLVVLKAIKWVFIEVVNRAMVLRTRDSLETQFS